MAKKISAQHRKDDIRRLLTEAAREGRKITYGELGKALGIPPIGPWKSVLDELSRNETEAGRPDITHLVVNANTGYPSQVEFQDARPPSDEQKARVDEIINQVWAWYKTS